MLSLLYIVLVISCLGALVWVLSQSLGQIRSTEQAAQENFDRHFGSVDALMNLSEIDRNRLRSMRDQGRLERWDAIRDVMRIENVPEEVATEFVDRL